MRLTLYEKWGGEDSASYRYTTVEFKNDSEGKIKFSRTLDGDFTIEAEEVTIAEMLEAIESLQKGVFNL